MLLTCDIGYRRLGKAEGIDWNYITTGACEYRFRLGAADKVALGGRRNLTFKNEWLEIAHDPADADVIVITIAPKYAFDGCSVVPDFDGTVDGSLPHDVLYQVVDELAKAWGVSVAQVLAFADLRFKDVMIYNKVPPAVYKTYYAGVSVFGWLFNRGRKFWRSLTGT